MNFEHWNWLNESKAAVSEEGVTIYVPGHVDWFRNPVPNPAGDYDAPVASAPVFYTEVTGDFVFSAKVRPNNQNVYDACALMAVASDTLWAKLEVEASEYGSDVVACVVTNEFSDDANGFYVEQDSVWLKMVRVGEVFSVHCSLDGENYRMVRVFRLPVPDTIKVGLEAQCPAGEGGERFFSEVKLEHRTVEHIRSGD